MGNAQCPMTADAPLGETPWRKPLPLGEDRTASPMPNALCPMPHDGRCSTWGDPKTALPPPCPTFLNIR
jgi:hypothetical protein